MNNVIKLAQKGVNGTATCKVVNKFVIIFKLFDQLINADFFKPFDFYLKTLIFLKSL